ncbi:MAG TPA: hypothetical protein DCM38_06710 [Gammaproteobacteria bacterium]|nr:hypothetical protein [Gammaproteobacteria bacterium]
MANGIDNLFKPLAKRFNKNDKTITFQAFRLMFLRKPENDNTIPCKSLIYGYTAAFLQVSHLK